MNLKIDDLSMSFTLVRQGHFWAGMAICLSTPIQFSGWGVVVATLVVILKELYWNWHLKQADPDIGEVIWTVFGAVCGLGMRDLGAVPFIVAGLM